MKTNIIYLMGAGRSGTTALATFLGNSKEVLTIGEMHQFFEHISEKKTCSCGEPLKECSFWSKVLQKLPQEYLDNPNKYKNFCEQFEYHSSIPKYLFNKYSKQDIQEYTTINETIFKAIADNNPQKRYFLDSAKYIGRFLGLRKSSELNIKAIYVIRDVRGVINSFSKSVQTPRKPLSTIVYWLIINSIAEFVFRTSPKGTVIKLKYEDFIENPIKEFNRLEKFLEIDLTDIKEIIKNDKSFKMPHIVGGNRMKTNKEIKFHKDIGWREKYSSATKLFYYLLSSPIMLLNRFKV